MSPLSLNIRFNSSHSIRLEVDPKWHVGFVKEILHRDHQIPLSNCRIIFQGHELADNFKIADCHLSKHSVLHVVQGNRAALHSDSTAATRSTVRASGDHLSLEASPAQSGLNQLTQIRQQDEGTSLTNTNAFPAIMYRPQYYVYCKSQCKAVCSGKLRVRCARCKQGAFIVDRDPCDWQDVLAVGQVTGHCEEEGCDGDIAEFCFHCCGHESETDSAVALDCIRTNCKQVPCITCMEIESPVVVFPCDSGHCICLECFHTYCVTKLNDRAFIQHPQHGYTLPCPAGCSDSYIREGHHFRILGNEQYERYQKFGTEECLLQMGGVLCPRAGCGAGLLPDPDIRRVICMQGCGYVFCRDCLEEFHMGDCEDSSSWPGGASGNTYQVNEDNARNAQWEKDSRDTIKKTTKTCPKCKVPTERDGGCMHMKCSRCCYQWCWMCHTEWNRECQGDHWFG